MAKTATAQAREEAREGLSEGVREEGRERARKEARAEEGRGRGARKEARAVEGRGRGARRIEARRTKAGGRAGVQEALKGLHAGTSTCCAAWTVWRSIRAYTISRCEYMHTSTHALLYTH
jgi:hypothetical protein